MTTRPLSNQKETMQELQLEEKNLFKKKKKKTIPPSLIKDRGNFG